jgi:hypothetical protein
LIANVSTDPSRFVPIKPGHQTKISLSDRTLGLRTTHRGKRVLAVRDETLLKLAGSRAVAKAAVQKFQQTKILVGGHGQRRTTQLPVSICVGEKTIKKPRFWLIKPVPLQKYVKNLAQRK